MGSVCCSCVARWSGWCEGGRPCPGELPGGAAEVLPSMCVVTWRFAWVPVWLW
jgi:hypothetical protein